MVPLPGVIEPVTFDSLGEDSATSAFADAYFDALRRHHLEDSHLTDLIKHYPGTGLSPERRIELNWPYLLEELAIVNAKIVVGVGSKNLQAT